MTITKQDVIDNGKELSALGLDDEMILGMTTEEINRYFTAENFTAMFGECDYSDIDLATWAFAARGQKFLLENLDKI